MTDLDVIEELERLLGEYATANTEHFGTERYTGAKNRVFIALRNSAASLLADARALRELVEKLPPCDLCTSVAIQAWYEELGAQHLACDAHAGGEFSELHYAAVIRRLEKC